MQFISNLLIPFTIWRDSVTDVATYPDLNRLSKRWKFFTLLVIYAVISVIISTHYYFAVLPQQIGQWRSTWETFKQSWPEDFVLIYQEGKLTSEPPANIAVPYPQPWENLSGLPQYFVRLDTTAEPQNQHDSLLFFTPEYIVAKAPSDIPHTISWTEAIDDEYIRLDKASLADFDPVVNEFLMEVQLWATLGRFLFGWLGLLLLRLAALLLYAWVAQTLWSLIGLKLSYRQTFSVGIIALFPAEILQTLLNLTIEPAPALFWWAWLAIMLIVGRLEGKNLR